MAADLHEPLLGRESGGEHDAEQKGSDRSWGASEEGGQSALTTHVAEPGDWGAFVQSLVANCVQGCRILIGVFCGVREGVGRALGSARLPVKLIRSPINFASV